jgi:hypothetical protein
MINILLDLVSYQEMQSFQIVKICIAPGIYPRTRKMTLADGRRPPLNQLGSLAEGGLVGFANFAVGEILEQRGISGALELLCGRYPGANHALFGWFGAKALA